MKYTTLRVSARGVVLFEEHAERLGPTLRPAFEKFAATASEGVYSLRGDADRLVVERRSGSRLHEGVVVRSAVSPMALRHGPFAKPAPPSPYDDVRSASAITLLTDVGETEIFECCVAAVMAWDGTDLVMVPADRPRVQSVAEAFVARDFPHRRGPIHTAGSWGLLLINAVGSAAPFIGAREPFPPDVAAHLQATIDATAVR